MAEVVGIRIVLGCGDGYSSAEDFGEVFLLTSDRVSFGLGARGQAET